MKKKSRNVLRKKRHQRIRSKLSGSMDIPRFNVFRSNKQLSVQIIDDQKGHTLVSASTSEKTFDAGKKTIAAAARLGTIVAERALALGVQRVIFDRGGYLYHGRVKALAEAAREAGLQF